MTTVNNLAARAETTLADPRWASVLARDGSADSQFFYSVRTTGVYCYPSCAARPPRPENVAFHRTRQDAESAGFRPCKRCKPEQPPLAARNAKKIAEACRSIEKADEMPSLTALAHEAGVSVYHFHRTFKAVTGLTPAQYAAAHRANRVRATLSSSDSVTGAIYDAGFNSNSRFYATSNEMLGMTPKTFRAGGARAEIRFAIGEFSLGSILVASSDRGVCAILIGDDPAALARDLEGRFPNANLIGGEPGYEELVSKVVGFVENPALGLDLPLDIRGTAFQQRVWKVLQQIPAGATSSYTDIAQRIGSPNSARAVAQACGANALAVAIPCHRVIRNDGNLSGYRWGVDRKQALLERESRT